MKIESIKVFNLSGYVSCKSTFYQACDICNSLNYEFHIGENRLSGEIDSGIWATSYVLSMYKYDTESIILSSSPQILANKQSISFDTLLDYSCYLDKTYPMFSTEKTVMELVAQGLQASGSLKTPEDIRSLFSLDKQRFERPFSGIGNEIYRAMAAVAFSHGKQIYCFPWLSKHRFEILHGNMTYLLELLTLLDKIAIVPVGE